MTLLKRQDTSQSNLTLDAAVIATAFANDGQDKPTAGQVASLTSTNNFMNFCLTVPSLPITNGRQISTGSCNPAPMGQLPLVDHIPATKFIFPANFGTLDAGADFNIQLAVTNLDAGFHTNENETFLSAPQSLNGQGLVQGYCTVVIEQLSGLNQTTPTDPNEFVFWRAITDSAASGNLVTDVIGGLPEGFYRITSTVYNMNHHPVLVSLESHGMMGDVVYFTVIASGEIKHTTISSPASEPSSTNYFTNKSSTPKPNIRVIVGGVIAGLIFLATSIFALWFLRRRHRQTRRSSSSSTSSGKICHLFTIFKSTFLFRSTASRPFTAPPEETDFPPNPVMANADIVNHTLTNTLTQVSIPVSYGTLTMATSHSAAEPMNDPDSLHPHRVVPDSLARSPSDLTMHPNLETSFTGWSRRAVGGISTASDITLIPWTIEDKAMSGKLEDKRLSDSRPPEMASVAVTPPSSGNDLDRLESERLPSWSTLSPVPSYRTNA